MTKPTFRRILAYIFDSIIVLIVTTALSSIKFLNPHMEEYENTYVEYNEYITEASQDPTTVNKIFSDENMNNIAYEMSYYGRNISIITLVVTFLYYVVFQFITKGKTAGKLIMGIEVIDQKGEELKFHQVLLRSLIINSLLTSLLLILTITFVSKGAFFKTNMIIQVIDMALLFVSFGMIISKENGVGLHDMLGHTMVIKSNEKVNIIKRLKKEESK